MTSNTTEHAKDPSRTNGSGSGLPLLFAGVGGVCLALGLFMFAGAATWVGMPALLCDAKAPQRGALLVGAVGAILLVGGALGLYRWLKSIRSADEYQEPKRSAVMYGRHLVGIGSALLIDAVLTIVIFLGLGRTVATDGCVPVAGGSLDGAASTGASIHELFGGREQAKFVAVMLLVSTLVALLGALFFFATSMWRRMDSPERQPFDVSLFWGGLWFRVGEAVLFNLVLFLVLRTYAPERFILLPIAALLVGMFLKSGEQLISGLANRAFAAFAELLPSKPQTREQLRILRLKPAARVFTSSGLSIVGDRLVKGLKETAGVSRVFSHHEAQAIVVEYDALRVDAARIRHELALQDVAEEAAEVVPGTVQGAKSGGSAVASGE